MLIGIATVRGVDLYPPPAGCAPPNCIFEVDDIQTHWNWEEPFDLIHIRQLLGAFTFDEWDSVYQHCFQLVISQEVFFQKRAG